MKTSDEYFSKVETAPREYLREFQLKQIRRIVKLAYERNRFYHRRLKIEGTLPNDMKSIEDFQRTVPIYSKEDVREEQQRMEGDASAGLYSHNSRAISNISLTSGTTGPNTFVVSNSTFLDEIVEMLAARELWMEKLRRGTKVACLPASWHFAALVQNSAINRIGAIPIHPYGSSTSRFAVDFIEIIRMCRPDFLMLTPTMLSFIVSACNMRGYEVARTFDSVKYVVLSGERISQTKRKKYIENLGLVDIFENAGSVDGMWGGGECYAHSAHHPWMDSNFLEVVDPRTFEPLARGERGLLVSTYLRGSGALYIRYNCGDIAEIPNDECECGRTHDQIEIHDRISNLVKIGGDQGGSKYITMEDIRSCIESFPETPSGLFYIEREKTRPYHFRIKILYEGKRNEEHSVALDLVTILRQRLGMESEIEWMLLSEKNLHGKTGNLIG